MKIKNKTFWLVLFPAILLLSLLLFLLIFNKISSRRFQLILIKPEKETYSIGEKIILEYRIKNISPVPIISKIYGNGLSVRAFEQSGKEIKVVSNCQHGFEPYYDPYIALNLKSGQSLKETIPLEFQEGKVFGVSHSPYEPISFNCDKIIHEGLYLSVLDENVLLPKEFFGGKIKLLITYKEFKGEKEIFSLESNTVILGVKIKHEA